MDKKIGYSPEDFETLLKEHKRRYTVLEEKFIEYRGHGGRVTLVRDNDTGIKEWCAKDDFTNYRVYGYPLVPVVDEFRNLVDDLIEIGAYGND